MTDQPASLVSADYAALLSDIKQRVRHGQTRAVLAVNAELIRLYWDIGALIHARQQQEGWGAGVIPRLARDLHNELPEEKGFSERNIKRMLAFYRERIPPPSICATSCGTNGARPKRATGCGTFSGGLGGVHPLGAPHRAHGQGQGPGCPPLAFIAASGQGCVHLKTTTPGLPAQG